MGQEMTKNKSDKKKESIVKNTFFKKPVLKLFIIAIVVGAGLIGWQYLHSKSNTESNTASESVTKKISFEDIGELATQVAYCTEVNVTEGDREFFGVTIPFTKSTYIYSYDVVIKAGFDFTEIDYFVNEETNEIEVIMPEVKILSNELNTDSFKLYYENESVFKQITMSETNDALLNLKKNAETNAIANGLLENAKTNAEEILKGFFSNAYPNKEMIIKFTYSVK